MADNTGEFISPQEAIQIQKDRIEAYKNANPAHAENLKTYEQKSPEAGTPLEDIASGKAFKPEYQSPLTYQKEAVKVQVERVQTFQEANPNITLPKAPEPVTQEAPTHYSLSEWVDLPLNQRQQINNDAAAWRAKVQENPSKYFQPQGYHPLTPEQKQIAKDQFQQRIRLTEQHFQLRRSESIGNVASSIKEQAVPIGLRAVGAVGAVAGAVWQGMKEAIKGSFRPEQKPVIVGQFQQPAEVKTAIGKPVQKAA